MSALKSLSLVMKMLLQQNKKTDDGAIIESIQEKRIVEDDANIGQNIEGSVMTPATEVLNAIDILCSYANAYGHK